MDFISHEMRIRRFIMRTEFPDDEMTELAKKEVSDTYLPSIVQHAETLVARHEAAVERGEASKEHPPLEVKKAALVLDHIEGLNKAKELLDTKRDRHQQIAADKRSGPINLTTLNLQ